MLRQVAIIYFSLACIVHAQTIIVNDNIQYFDFPDERITFRVSKYIEHGPGSVCDIVGCFTDIEMAYDGTTIAVETITLDEQSDWYLVEPGDAFSDAAIAAVQFPVLFDANWPNTPIGGPVSLGSGEFYLGVRTGAGFGGGPNRTAYGWVHLRPDGGGLTMVENVMSYNSRGIIVGTTTVVPEPAALAIVAIAVSLLAAVDRRRVSRLVRRSGSAVADLLGS